MDTIPSGQSSRSRSLHGLIPKLALTFNAPKTNEDPTSSVTCHYSSVSTDTHESVMFMLFPRGEYTRTLFPNMGSLVRIDI